MAKILKQINSIGNIKIAQCTTDDCINNNGHGCRLLVVDYDLEKGCCLNFNPRSHAAGKE
jgi:hypothetical protein